jgi:hypothetical protein
MTQFGIDIASWQAGLNMDRVAAEGFRYVLAKATEGSDYTNPQYGAQKAGALRNNLHFAAYHYVKANVSARAQVDNFEAAEPDRSTPVMLDHEAGGGGIEVLRNVHAEFVARGYRVILMYVPNWYWSGTMGSPDLSGLPPLMSSNYGNERSGYAAAIYPGDGDVGWNGYGGLGVSIFQFTQKASVAGQSIDASAFRGTELQLAALFAGVPNFTEALMSLSDDELGKKFPSRSKYRTNDDPIDTLAGFVLNIDARIHEEFVEREAAKGVQWAFDLVKREAAKGDPGAKLALEKVAAA